MANLDPDQTKSNNFIYTPDSDLKVHEEGAIKLMCASFQSHENGIPEWVKNCSDAYAREDFPEAQRIIILILDPGNKNSLGSISCLDFVGMTSHDIENYFRNWADPNAAIAGKKTLPVQGGHGNGGKCYMIQMFTHHSQLHTVRFNKGCTYGVRGGSIRFGYIPDTNKGKDVDVESIEGDIKKALSQIRCPYNSLPKQAIELISSNILKGYTLVSGFGPKGYEDKLPLKQLIRELNDHPQMLRSIELCKIYFITNGRLYNFGKPLSLPDIKPLTGGEQPRSYEIPSRLLDPATRNEISTTTDGKFHRGKLVLFTSEKSMRYGMKARHTVRFKSELLGDYGYIPISELDIQSTYKDHIYGICYLEALEQYKKNERARLAESPLTRAIENFIAEKVQEYAREFEAKDRRRFDKEEREALSKMNEALDRWKNKFLKETMRGSFGPGKGTETPVTLNLPKGVPTKIELSLSHRYAGLGIIFRPTIKFYDAQGRQIRAIPIRLCSEDNNIAMGDDNMQITTFSFGKTEIWAEALDGNLCSNKVWIEVVNIKRIDITPEIIELDAGSRFRLAANCLLSDNEIISDIYLIWTENDNKIAGVSSAGLVYAFSPGETTVIAGDNKCQSRKEAIIKVKPSEGRGQGQRRGRGFPLVLISEFDNDPDSGQLVSFSSDEPPVLQRPADYERNIWWINSSAPLAKLYLDSSRGYGQKSREWRVYHLERYIEVIIQILLKNETEEGASLSHNDWVMKWGGRASEIQNAVASDLSEFILTGEFPSPQ